MANPSDNNASYIVPDDNPYASDDPAFLTDSDSESATKSLSSSVLHYQYENGRRYHAYKEGAYFLPNDEREQDRLDLHHHICRLAIGGALFRAPINASDARILDLGTGTGIWAIQVADEFPGATVKGTDLSPIQPGYVPLNCHFEVDDFESTWEFAHKFDFIYARNLGGSLGNWPALYRNMADNLNPGGWVEVVDFSGYLYSDDGTMENAPNITRWTKLLDEASAGFGKPLNIPHNHKQWMIDAGFKDVREEIYKVSSTPSYNGHVQPDRRQIPTNPWPKQPKMKELGRFQQVNFLEGMEAHTLALLTRVLGWDPIEVQLLLAEVRKELTDRSIHSYAKFYFVYGQKPE